MDLLGGYSSSSDSDSEKVSPVRTLPALSTSTGGKPVIPNNEAATRKGKKLLKLQAVLPQHIWNQLSGANHGLSDSDEDDNEPEVKLPKPDAPSHHINRKEKGGSSGLSDLLKQLPKTKTSTVLNQNETILGTSSTGTVLDTTTEAISSPKPAVSSSKLGTAFGVATVQVERRKKGEVVDVHGGTNPSTNSDPSSAPSIPTVRRPSSLPYQSVKPMSRNATPQVAQRRQPGQAGIVPSTTLQAPAVSRSRPGGKKSRKRQMEAMLRAGQISEVQSDFHLQGQEASYTVPQNVQQAQYQAHGVRVVPTAQYDVGTGQMSTSANISGRQRGKNQLNSLMASAASLEAARLRNPQIQKTQRANSKRKYGW